MSGFVLDPDFWLYKALAKSITEIQPIDITMDNGNRHLGYVSGVDPEWIQLIKSDDFTILFVSVSSISSVSLRRTDHKMMSPEAMEKIKFSTQRIRTEVEREEGERS